MRTVHVLIGSLLFAGGLVLGYHLGVTEKPPVVGPSLAGAGSRAPVGVRSGAERGDAPWALLRRALGRGSRPRSSERDSPEAEARDTERLDSEERAVDPEAALAGLEAAVARGNIDAAHEAAGALARAAREGDLRLEAEQIERLGKLLEGAGPGLSHALARALAEGGGPEGISLVLGLAADSELPFERRREMLDALGGLSPEAGREAFGPLADFLESGPPEELARAAAGALARTRRDEGVDPLLDLLVERPEIRRDVIFDAMGDVGKLEDATRLLGALPDAASRRETASLLRAASRIAARAGDTSMLLDLMRETPEGISRAQVARALAESSEDLPLSVLRDALRETGGDRRAQEWLARSLARSGGREGLDALLEAARDPGIGLRDGVLAEALAEYRGPEANPVRLELFRRARDEGSIKSLARGLVRGGDAETLEDLFSVFDSGGAGGDVRRRQAVAWALEEGGAAVVDEERLLSWLRGESDGETATALAEAWARRHPADAARRAEDRLAESPSSAERVAMARLLAHEEGPAAAERIAAELSRERDERASHELARLLGGLGARGSSEVESMLAREGEEHRRHALLEGLAAGADRGNPDSRGALLRVARADPSPGMREHAVEIMAHRGGREALPDLRALLEAEASPEVRAMIQGSIDRLTPRGAAR